MVADFGGRQSKSIFVGNIPFEATEEKLREIIGVAGKIVNFRLVSDKETGRSKGYGFFEFESPEIAQSALRNLSTVEYEGRPLRIGPATAGDLSFTKPNYNNNQLQMNHNTDFSSISMNDTQIGGFANNLEARNEKMQVNQNNLENVTHNNSKNAFNDSLSIQNEINPTFDQHQTLEKHNYDSKDVPLEISRKMTSLSPELLQQIVQQIKVLAINDPDQAKSILIHYPHLAYAILQAMILTNSIKPTDALKLLRPIQKFDQVNNLANYSTNQDNFAPNTHFFTPENIPQHQEFFKVPQNQPNLYLPSHQQQINMPYQAQNNQHVGMHHINDSTNIQKDFNSNTIINQFQHQSHNYMPFQNDQHQMYQPQPESTLQPVAHQNPVNNNNDEKEELIRQVMMLTEEQINLLPLEQQESVRILRSQVQNHIL